MAPPSKALVSLWFVAAVIAIVAVIIRAMRGGVDVTTAGLAAILVVFAVLRFLAYRRAQGARPGDTPRA